MKYYILILGLLALSACKVSHDLDLNRIKVGMSRHEVRIALKKDSTFLINLSSKAFGFSNDTTKPWRCDILEYDNHIKKNIPLSVKMELASNPTKRAEVESRSRYWLYFYNDQLKYIKWGQTSSWKAIDEIDSLIVDELKNEDPDKIKIFRKILKIGRRGKQ